MSFRYRWSSSDTYGFVRRARLVNLSDTDRDIAVLDGLQNILPYGVPSDLQMRSSNLVDAYKRSELHRAGGLGIFALSAIIVDKAEPSEALKANVAWSLGLDDPTYLLSSLQLDAFRDNEPLREETDVKGEKGAYFAHQRLSLPAGGEREWMQVLNVNQNHAAVAQLIHDLEHDAALATRVREDIERGMSMGAADYLIKAHFMPSEVVDKIKKVLNN